MTAGSDLDVAALVGKIAPILHDDLERRFIDERPHPAGLGAMAGSGLLGLTLPRRYGGLGGDYRALGRAAEALARIDLAYQITLTVHLALTAMTLLQWGGEAQRRRWLPVLARGELIATFGLTEPGAGSDVAAVRMRAVRDGDVYRLSGEKSWISDANTADLFLLFATLDSSARHKGLTAFLVPRETPGLSTTVLHGKLGVRAGDTGTVVCDDAIVPADSRIGDEGEGFPIALSGLASGLFTVGYGALGVLAESLRLTVDLVRALDRRGCAAGRNQLVQREIAAMISGEARARLLLDRAVDLKNRGLPNQRQTSLAKWVAADEAYRAAEAALAIHQAYAVEPAAAIERHLRNSKGSVIYGGTAEIHQTMQAAYALGDRIERPFRIPAPTAADLAGIN